MWQKITFFAFAFILSFCSAIGQDDIDFFEEYFTLNRKHELLSQFVGKWKVNIVYFGPTNEEYVSGELSSSFTFSYRILEMNFNLTNPTGLPFEMKYLIGYDGVSKKFFLIILNNLTNEVQILKGSYSEKTKDFVFTGSTVDTKLKKRIPMKMKIFFERENKFLIESFVENLKGEKIVSRFVLIKKPDE
ncbi:MAG: DUF1579 family protein [Candidatus Kapaibacteriota bacterium]|jgi:hypothetical protein